MSLRGEVGDLGGVQQVPQAGKGGLSGRIGCMTGRKAVMHVSVRQPDGGEIILPLGKADSVDQLRAMIKWCVENNDWDFNAIPRDIKRQHGKGEDASKEDDEMWTLNEQVESNPLDHDDAPDDLEASHRRANTLEGEIIENVESGRIEILHGPVMLQDGCLLSEYGVEDGSFLHPLYTLRGAGGADGRTWGFTVAQLPWSDREWYRAGTSSALASVSSWWTSVASSNASAASPQSSPTTTDTTSAPSPSILGEANSDEQLPGVFGTGQDDNCAL